MPGTPVIVIEKASSFLFIAFIFGRLNNNAAMVNNPAMILLINVNPSSLNTIDKINITKSIIIGVDFFFIIDVPPFNSFYSSNPP